MMHDFLQAHREELIERCKAKVASRYKRHASLDQLQSGIPLFLDQLIQTLRIEQSATPLDSRRVSGNSGGDEGLSEMGSAAGRHGADLLRLGFTVDQVVHDYGDLCQAITDLAFETGMPILVDEFRTLNRCLDNAIADAVSAFCEQRDTVIAERSAAEMNEQLGFFAHELRNVLATATLAFTAARMGGLSLSGATGSVLERSLVALKGLIDRSLAEVRLRSRDPLRTRKFSLAEFIADIQAAADLEANLRRCQLEVLAVDPQLAVIGNHDLLMSAMGNLLQNAFKFTLPGSQVSVRAYGLENRILIDVADHCGGLPAGDHEHMFVPFTQGSEDRSGLGLGLSIARRSVELNQGTLTVTDVPGVGCIFTINLPRYDLQA